MNGDTWTIAIRQPAAWISSNDSKHWAAKGRLVRAWRAAAYQNARGHKPRIPTGLDLVRVDVLFRWAMPPVEEMDNLHPTIKACVDGAVGPARRSPKGGIVPGYGIVVADSDRHVVYGPYQQEIAPKLRLAGMVLLTVTDLSASGVPGRAA